MADRDGSRRGVAQRARAARARCVSRRRPEGLLTFTLPQLTAEPVDVIVAEGRRAVPAESPFDPANRLRRDIGRHLRGAFLLVAIGLTLGVALMPRGDELLLIHVRNRDLDRRAPRAGRPRGAAASRPCRPWWRTASCSCSKGTSTRRWWISKRSSPGTSTTRRRGDGWRASIDTRSVSTTRFARLAQVYRLEPTPEPARRLAMFYRWTGDEAKETALLHELVTGGHAEWPKSGGARASKRRSAGSTLALAALERLAVQAPADFEYADLDLLASLLVDAGAPRRWASTCSASRSSVVIPATLTQLATSCGAAAGRWRPCSSLPRRADGRWRRRFSPVAPARPKGRRRRRDVLRELLEADAAHPLTDEPLEATVKLSLSLHDSSAIDQLFARHAGALAPEARRPCDRAGHRPGRPRARAGPGDAHG